MYHLLVLLTIGLCTECFAQRVSVRAREVTGTYRQKLVYGFYDEVRIVALGDNRLYVEFDFVRPKAADDANLGWTRGFAWIEGDSATFRCQNEWTDVKDDRRGNDCVITLKFTRPGKLLVDDMGRMGNDECGFGLGVSGKGTYTKISGKKPKMDQPEHLPERRAVSAKEVTGTFVQRSKYSDDSIRIVAIGNNRLEIECVFNNLSRTGSDGKGRVHGVAIIKGNIAIMRRRMDNNEGDCRIALKFTKPGELLVADLIDPRACKLGLGSGGYGTYTKLKPR